MKFRLLPLLLIALVAFTGCESDDDSPTGPNTPAAGPRILTLTANNTIISVENGVEETVRIVAILTDTAHAAVSGATVRIEMLGLMGDDSTRFSCPSMMTDAGGHVVATYRASMTGDRDLNFRATSDTLTATVSVLARPYYRTQLEATVTGQYKYFDLVNRALVNITNAEAPTNSVWSIAFARYLGKLSGGDSGPNGIVAVDLATLGSADSTNFDGLASAPAVGTNDWQADAITFALADWYNYNPSTHQITPSRDVFVIKTADGKYAKMVIDSINGYGRADAGTLNLKYVYQADGSVGLTGGTVRYNLDCSAGSAYFSFATGGAVVVNDPMNSTAWDFKVDGWDIKLNSAIHGPGQAAVSPGGTDFDAVTDAPNAPQAYMTDGLTSIFGTATEHPWFRYSDQHELITKNHVYLLKFPDNRIFKLQIENYYKIVSGSPQSGWVQFRFREI